MTDTADIGELVATHRSICAYVGDIHDRTARALTALEARCAELEKERDYWKSADEASTEYIAALRDRIEREPVVTDAADLHLTEYEIQVLLGTSIHGCNMPPDRVFSLPMAWHRLHAIGLIDRTDGLAIITEKGCDVVARILSALASAPERVETGNMHLMGAKQTIIQEVWTRLEGPHGLMRNVPRSIVEQGVEIALHILRRHGITLASPPAPVVTDEMVEAGEAALRERTDVYFDGSEVVHDGAVRAILEAALASREANR